MKKIKILIAEDQEILRNSLDIMLKVKFDFEVVGLAKNGLEAIEYAKKLKPDVILMDVRMPEIDGVKCTEIIKSYNPDIKIIVLTTFDDDDYIINALKNGASGYLLKGISVEELEKSIKTVANGGAIMNTDVTAKVLDIFSRMANSDYTMERSDIPIENLLSNTETKVLKMVGIGLSNKEIASKLHLSEGTIRNYISSILSKLNLSNRTQIAIYAVQSKLVTKD